MNLEGVAASPSADELLRLGAPVVLRDGSRVRIRQGRRSDGELLARGFRRLSPDSRYRRFLNPISELSGPMLRLLTDVDHHDRESMVALDEQSGEGLGVARYVRYPDRPDAAEVAVTVIDDWQGRGLGTELLHAISGRAREEGIGTFTALMLGSNADMMDLLRQLGPVRIVDREAGTVEVELPIPPVGVAPSLRELLRIAAHHDVAVPLGRGDGRARPPSDASGHDRDDS
jgi:GNAT superfamily N-acetyltransferase